MIYAMRYNCDKILIEYRKILKLHLLNTVLFETFPDAYSLQNP